MKLPTVRELKDSAGYAYRRARDPQKLILAYAGISVLLGLMLTVAADWLRTQISGTGGLSNFGIRSILSTAQSVLPMVQTCVLVALEFGYLHAILRMARGQYADHTDLKVGFHRFFPFLRLSILQSARFLALAFVTFYASVTVFLYTPWSEPLVALLEPLIAVADNPKAILSMMDQATLAAAMEAMMPMMVIFVIAYAAVAIPMFYRLRMSVYLLLDDPHGSAMMAMRNSTQMMHGNKLGLLKLDLSFWWYYLLSTVVAALSYGDVILAMLGIPLPFNDTVAYYLFYILYLAGLFAIYCFLRNRMEITYAIAYESMLEKPKEDGAVLGNIFDM